jgi:hypothetical protein
MRLFISGLLLTTLVSSSQGQTCCSGGVPLSSNLGFGITQAGNWQFSVNYDINVLNTLKDGTIKLDDNTRKRTTLSTLGQIGYTFSNRFSADIFFSYVTQKRLLTPKDQPANNSITSGFGDVVILPKIRLYKNYQAGIGIKAPVGATELRNDQGLVLSPDLQPGSGAWDLIYWLNGTQPLGFRPSMSLIGTISLRATGTNNTYLGDQTYTFGDEILATVAIADKFVLGSFIIDPSLGFKYRHVKPDVKNGGVLPSTGGEWVFVNPGLLFQITPQTTLQANIELPLYANLEGTQVTPTYRINFGLIFLLEHKQYQNNEIKGL